MAEKNNGAYKSATTHLVTIILTGAIAWVSFGGGINRTEAERIALHAAQDSVESVPTRDEVSEMIEVESPYVADKSAIEVRLKNIEDMVSRIERKVSQ